MTGTEQIAWCYEQGAVVDFLAGGGVSLKVDPYTEQCAYSLQAAINGCLLRMAEQKKVDMDPAERKVVLAIIDAAIAEGCAITVNDGTDDVLTASLDRQDIFAAMYSTEQNYLYLNTTNWIRLVYGNGPDVICDHSDNEFTNKLLAPALELANTLSGA